MDIKTMPKETLAELLLFLAENEEFSSLQKLLDGGFAPEEVQAAFRELAVGLRQEAIQETSQQIQDVKNDSFLTKKTKTIISSLSPIEEKTLLTVFGLIEKQDRG